MLKFLTKNIILIGLMLFMAESALASGLTIRLEQPKSPTSDNEFKLNFVTLNTENKPITVKCFKKGPAEESFVQYGSDINLSSGGNTGNCQVTQSVINTYGSYQFYTLAETDSDSATSSTVTVEYKGGNPATPYNFSKEKIGSCEYKINFKTGADNGITKKVEIYMSTLTNFGADSGTKVGEVGIGSDQEGSFNKIVSDCEKTHYFAIRAFDDTGNGSGVVGDSFTTLVTKTSQTVETVVSNSEQTSLGAIPVSAGQVTEEGTLGEATSSAINSEISGNEDTNVQPQESQTGTSDEQVTFRDFMWLFIASHAIGGMYFYRKLRDNNFSLWKKWKKWKNLLPS